jgi:hypothetical protein
VAINVEIARDLQALDERVRQRLVAERVRPILERELLPLDVVVAPG